MDVNRRKVWMTSSKYVSKVCDKLPSNEGRQSLVDSLINAYGLDRQCDGIIPIFRATRRDLELFHGKDFVEEILRNRTRVVNKAEQFPASDSEESEEESGSDNESLDDDTNSTAGSKFGLIHDCYIFEGLDEYVKVVAGSSISTAKKLMLEYYQNPHDQHIAINWYGGRHHCHKSSASGFCYVNDIVLAISTLRTKFKSIFYLDLDLHHGDGVENAFKNTKSITTCSIHRFESGFFPGTGLLLSSNDSTINIPTKKGLSDESLMKIIDDIIIPILQKKHPEILVIQAGCDGLFTDKYKQWNLTIKGIGTVIDKLLLVFKKPVMILGGGGYNNPEVAKCWCYITKVILNVNDDKTHECLDNNSMIPEHKLLDCYSDSGYSFWTLDNTINSKMRDENTNDYINDIKEFLVNKAYN